MKLSYHNVFHCEMKHRIIHASLPLEPVSFLLTGCVTTTGKPELPRQPGSSAFYESESPPPAQTPDGANVTESEASVSNDANSSNFFQTLDWEGKFTLL